MQVARPFGVPLRIHFLLPVYLAAIAFVTWNGSGPIEAGTVLASLAILFACVTLHEFGHVLAAARLGIRTQSVTLFPFGGLAQLDRMPERPSQEMFVALAGPAVNVGLAVAGWSAGRLFFGDGGTDGWVLDRFVAINVGLAVFNLIPAFPMDGGRVLRAILSVALPRSLATTIAVLLGQTLAFALAWIGWTIDQPMLILVAAFVFVIGPAESGRGPFWFVVEPFRRLVGSIRRAREA